MESSKIQNILFFSTLAFVTILFLYVLMPFFYPIFWAAVIASIFKPLYRKLNERFKRPSMSATMVMLTIALIIILPGSIVGSLLFTESVRIYNSLDTTDSSNIEKSITGITSAIKHNTYLAKLNINDKFLKEKIAEITKSISNYILVSLKNLTQNTILFAAQFAVMLYTLFYFIRDGDKFLGMVMRLFTFGKNKGYILYERFVNTAKSTLKVTLIIGGLQGLLGAFIFFITGIEAALIWGVIMVLTAIVPVVGCSIIWAPAGVIMLLTGNIWQGTLILAFGVLVISMADNFLRPILLGRDVQMHPLLIFLSTLGGLSLFGFSGFVIGPIISSLFLAIWEMYDQFYLDT